jgi:enediyne biosynthesis protein E4
VGSTTLFPERAFINDASTNGNHWLYVELVGPTDNTSGIGATLYATINESTPEEVTLRREANTNAGTFNQSDLPVHFGLGTAELIDELKIRWPNGQMQTLFDVSVDQYLMITIPNPGDFDGDGDVDGRDFLVWQRNPSVGDLADWQANYGAGPLAATSVAVPEPTGALLLALGSMWGISQGFRRGFRSKVLTENHFDFLFAVI